MNGATMTDSMPTLDDLDALTLFDTPTICNALELLAPATRAAGYTTLPSVCGFPQQKPVIGYARTATIRSAAPSGLNAADQRALLDDYYRAIEVGPMPSLIVIQDLDPEPGHGAFWGEVQSAIHVGLGVRGLITNGSVRDLDQWAPGFQFLAGSIAASHAFAKPVRVGGDVEVFGLRVREGDLLHADRHGAVIVPASLVRTLPGAVREIMAREARILAIARGPGCTAAALIDVMHQLDAIH
jgi:regulator of RNase E activity RraA